MRSSVVVSSWQIHFTTKLGGVSWRASPTRQKAMSHIGQSRSKTDGSSSRILIFPRIQWWHSEQVPRTCTSSPTKTRCIRRKPLTVAVEDWRSNIPRVPWISGNGTVGGESGLTLNATVSPEVSILCSFRVSLTRRKSLLHLVLNPG